MIETENVMMDPWVWTFICLGLAILFAVLELLVASSGLLAFLSVVALGGSIVFAFMHSPIFGGVYLLCLTAGIPVILWYVFRWWPHSPMGRRILLNPEDDPALQPDMELLSIKQLIGKRGVARSKMMLSGLIEVDGRRLNALSESEPLEPGDEIVVVSVDGVNILVRKLETIVSEPQTAEEKIDAIEDPFA